MTREQLLESALKALKATARPAIVAQERYDYWTQFGTDSPTARRATVRHERLIERLGAAEEMADAAIRDNVTLFNEANARFKEMK